MSESKPTRRGVLQAIAAVVALPTLSIAGTSIDPILTGEQVPEGALLPEGWFVEMRLKMAGDRHPRCIAYPLTNVITRTIPRGNPYQLGFQMQVELSADDLTFCAVPPGEITSLRLRNVDIGDWDILPYPMNGTGGDITLQWPMGQVLTID